MTIGYTAAPAGRRTNEGYNNVNFYHAHNLVDSSTVNAERTFGIRVRLPAGDAMGNILGKDFERLHWFVSEEERDEQLDAMKRRHGYYRDTDTPTQILEKVSR